MCLLRACNFPLGGVGQVQQVGWDLRHPHQGWLLAHSGQKTLLALRFKISGWRQGPKRIAPSTEDSISPQGRQGRQPQIHAISRYFTPRPETTRNMRPLASKFHGISRYFTPPLSPHSAPAHARWPKQKAAPLPQTALAWLCTLHLIAKSHERLVFCQPSTNGSGSNAHQLQIINSLPKELGLISQTSHIGVCLITILSACSSGIARHTNMYTLHVPVLCRYIHIYIYTCIYNCRYIYIYMYICIYVYMYICICVCNCLQLYIVMYMYVCMYMYTLHMYM